MIIPRRVRRRLLLPPGWVALGFLLLLACQALQPWARQLKRWNVLQLTMPVLRPDTSFINFYKRARIPYRDYASESPNRLAKLRPWHDAEFRGASLADFLNAAVTESAVRSIIADSSRAGGVRIRFWPGATYANLVNVLEVMNHTGQRKYWLDIRNHPTTLYAITDEPTSVKPALVFSCGTRYMENNPVPKVIDIQEVASRFGKELASLASQPWQAVTWWLAILSSLSLWKLIQPKLKRFNS